MASICEGLLANNSVVFQTKLFVENFALTCQAFLPDVERDLAENTILHQGHRTRLWSNPVSVDIYDLRSLLASPAAAYITGQTWAVDGGISIKHP